jgi:hypothetical protein
MSDLNLGTKEVKDLTRIERIGAHSHIRGKYIYSASMEQLRFGSLEFKVLIQ